MANDMRGRPIKLPVIDYELKPDVDLEEAENRLDRMFEILFDEVAQVLKQKKQANESNKFNFKTYEAI